MTTAAGALAWLDTLALLPAPLAARILLLAPLVIVPRLLGALPGIPGPGRLAGWPALVAALALTAAFALPAGPAAALLATPWLAVTALAGLAAIAAGLPRLPGLLHPDRAAELGPLVALGFLAVAGVFTMADRAGLRPLDFPTVIILLTATHFHFAGFGLLAVAGRLATRRPWLRAPVLGLAVGIPLTAVGFTVPSDEIAAIGAVFVGLSGIAVGVGLLLEDPPGLARWALRAAGAALLVGMPMGIAWSLAIALGLSFVDLDTMVRTHGVLNASAVLVATLATTAPEP